MKFLAILSLFVILFATTGFAAIVEVDTIQDSYITLNSTDLGNHGSDAILRMLWWTATQQTVHTFYQFNTSDIRQQAFDGMNLSLFVASTNQSNFNCKANVTFILNNTWSEGAINGTNFPNVTGSQQWANMNTSGSGQVQSSDPFKSVNSDRRDWIGTVYSQDLVTIAIPNRESTGACNNDAHVNVSSKEGTNPPILRFNSSTFITHTILGTDVNVTCFDFESGSAETGTSIPTATFPQADFCYDAVNNVLEPLNPAVFPTRGTTNSSVNDLDLYACSGEIGYGLSSFFNINTPATDFEVFCFNQTNSHGGVAFFGAIKVVNNTNVRGGSDPEFDFHYAIYSPSFVTFSIPVVSPEPIIKTTNATFSWASSRPLTTGIRIRNINSFGVSSPIITQSSAFNLTSSHSIVIEQDAFFADTVRVEVQVFGQDINTTFFNSPFHNFEVTGVATDDVSFLLTLAQFQSGIHVLAKDQNGLYLSGTLVSLDGQVPVLVTATNVPDNSTLGFHTVWAASFFPVNATGVHNITATHENFVDFSTSIVVTVEPHFEEVFMTTGQGCFVENDFPSRNSTIQVGNATLAAKVSLGLNATSWTCDFNPNKCLVFNTDGSCATYGKWDLTICLDGVHPDGLPVNNCAALGAQETGTAGLQGGFDALAFLLGTNIEGAQMMISMLITIIAMFAITAVTKSGIAGVTTFLGMMVMFTGIGWLPVVILIILGLLAAFIASRMIRSGIATEA